MIPKLTKFPKKIDPKEEENTNKDWHRNKMTPKLKMTQNEADPKSEIDQKLKMTISKLRQPPK